MKLLQLSVLFGAAFIVTAPVQAANRISCPNTGSLTKPVPTGDQGEWIFKASTTNKDKDTGKEFTSNFEGTYKLRGGEEPALKLTGSPTADGLNFILPCEYTMSVNDKREGILTMRTSVEGYKKCYSKGFFFLCEK